MIKNKTNTNLINTLIMCFFSFVMFFSSVHELFNHVYFDNIEIVDDLDKNKSEKEVDEKIEFEDEFVKTSFTHHFLANQFRKRKFQKPDDEIRNAINKIFIPPPRCS